MYEIVYNPKFVPVRAPMVSVKTVTEKTKTIHLMRNHRTGQYFELDEASKKVWDLTDGKRTVGQIVREAQASGHLPEDDTVVETLLFFAESGALAAEQDLVRWKRIRIVSSFETQVTIIRDSRKILRLAHRILRPILQGFLFWTSMALVIVGAIIFAPRFASIFDNAGNFQILGSTVVGFLFYQFIVLSPVIAVHELAHGLALVHYGGRPGEIGTGLFYFGPMFYVDASDYFSLPRRQRIMVMWAGNLTTVLIGALIAISRLLIKYPASLALLSDMTAFWCFYITLYNLAPPFETDGYYILTDLVGMPDLKHDGFSYLKSVILHFFRGSSSKPEAITSRKRAILLGYSIFSIAFVGYIAFQSFRFTLYMAQDAGSWAGRVWLSGLSGRVVSPLEFGVGLASVAYFLMTLGGYGVVVGNQLRKSLLRTLQFEAVHDRNLSAFFYLPTQLPTSLVKQFETKVLAVARRITSNFSAGWEASLFYVTLRIGGATLPLSQIRTHIRRIEYKFYRVYQSALTSKDRAAIKHLLSSSVQGPISNLLSDMAEKTPPGEKSEVKKSLKEFLQRQEKTIFYLLSSSFATVWTIEIPPAQQYQLLESLLPNLLVEDLTMTDLVDEVEDFKKRTVYGLDSIAELAAGTSAELEAALTHPEKFQLVTVFEPVRGRIIFTGRTQRIEKHLKELGSLYIIHLWSGYLDSLLGDVNLNLLSIVHSLPPIPRDTGILRDGEVKTLCRYVCEIEQLKNHVKNALTRCQETVQPCKTRLKELNKLFQPDKASAVGLIDSVLSLNRENVRSIPYRLKALETASNRSFGWIEALEKRLGEERRKRQAPYLTRKKRFVRTCLAFQPVLAVLIIAGLLSPTSVAMPLFSAATSIQLALLGYYYLLWRAGERVLRHPSAIFTQLMTPMYGLTQTLFYLAVGASILDPAKVLEKADKKKGKVGWAKPGP